MYSNTAAINRPDLDLVVMEHIGINAKKFIGTKLFPIMPVPKEADRFKKVDYQQVDKDILDNKKVSTSGYNRMERTISQDSYDCSKYGLEEPLDDDDVKRVGLAKAEANTASLISFVNLRKQDQRIAKVLWSPTNFTSDYQFAVSTSWNNAAAKVKEDVRKAKAKLEKNIGGIQLPGCKLVLALNSDVLDNIYVTNEVYNRTLYTRRIEEGDPELTALASYLGVDEIIVSRATVKKTHIYSGTYAMLAIVSENSALNYVPRLGNTFLWKESTASNNVTQTYRDEKVEADIVRVKHNVDEKLITKACAILLTGVTA